MVDSKYLKQEEHMARGCTCMNGQVFTDKEAGMNA